MNKNLGALDAVLAVLFIVFALALMSFCVVGLVACAWLAFSGRIG